MDYFDSIWADAFATYEKQTNHSLKKDSAFRRFKTIEDLQDAIEQDRNNFSSFREEHRRVLRPLSKAIAPVLPLINLVQQGIGNTPYAPLSAVLGASSLLLRACQTVSKAFDGIEALFEQIAAITIRLQKYEVKNIDASLKLKITQILGYILEIIGKAEAVVKRKRIKQWLRSVFTQDDEIQDSITKLQQHVEQEFGLVIALTYGHVMEIRHVADDVRSQVSDIRAGVSELLVTQRNDRQRAFSETDEKLLIESLKTGTMDEIYRQHARNVESLTKGTGLWLKDDEMFQAWEDERAPILWVFGKPGVGKTMLAARMVETLLNKYSQHDVTLLTSVSYLYFKDDKPNLRDCDDMWKTAILQATKTNAPFKKFVINKIKSTPEVLSSARRIWQDLFLAFFTEPVTSSSLTSLAFLVIDGLDEAPESERVKLLYCLGELVRRTTRDQRCRVQVAIFCRPDVRADAGFERVGFRRRERIIEVTSERNTLDIEAFIKQRLAEVVVLGALKQRKATKDFQNLAKQIFNEVLARSQGMFLWASLMFDQIKGSPSPESVRSALQQAPSGLDGMLHHVFLRLNAEEQFHQSYLSHLLSWTYCTNRPLKISELFVLILITSSQHCVMLEKDLRSRYSSLFLVDDHGIDGDSVQEDVWGPPEAEICSEHESETDGFDFLTSPDDDNDDGDNVETLSTSNESLAEDSQHSTTRDNVNGGDQSEDETSFRLSPGWYEDGVVFSHARIRDYLRTEGDPQTRRWFDCAIVPEDLNAFQLLATMACLTILTSDIALKYEVYSLIDYANLNWMKHLLEVDLGGTPTSFQVQTAQNLAAFFSNGSAVHTSASRSWDHFHATWFRTSRYSNLVRGIIGNHIEELDPGLRPWAERARDSVKELFAPFIEDCASTWLTKTGWEDPGYLDKRGGEVRALLAYARLGEDDEDGEFQSTVTWMDLGQIPPSELEALANRPNIEKTAHWHAGLAWTLMEVDETAHTQLAIDHFRKALELSPNGWMALEGLAKCYGDNQHNYSRAVTTMEEAIQCLPKIEAFGGIDHLLLVSLADWKLKLDDSEAAEIGRIAFESGRGYTWGAGLASDRSLLRSIKFYLEVLFKDENYHQLMDVVSELRETATYVAEDSLFIIFLRHQQDDDYDADIFTKVSTIGRLWKDASQVEMLIGAVQEACSLSADNITDDNRVSLILRCANFADRYAEEISTEAKMLEKLIHLIDDGDEAVQQGLSSERTQAADRLSRLVLTSTIAAHDGGQDCSKGVSQLENLATHKQGSKRFYRASYSALALGLWLREYANAERDAWQACIRPSITQALYLLTDEDPWNDQQAYSQLGTALLFAGDFENAAIALGITLKPLETEQSLKANLGETELDADDLIHGASKGTLEITQEEVSKEDPSVETQAQAEASIDPLAQPSTQSSADPTMNFRYTGFDLLWVCDGPCETEHSDYAELHFCCFCDDAVFCEKCIKLVQDETMPYRRCSKSHKHLKVFPMSEEAARITDALVSRRYEVQQEWLDKLKSAWIL